MPTEADLERSFYGANLGLTEAQISAQSMSQLRAGFLALALTKTPNPKTTVAAASSTGVINPANAAYTVADQTALAASVQGLVTQFNALRTALINAGLIQ